MQTQDLTADDLYGHFQSLERIKGLDAINRQIRRFENEWLELTQDAKKFAVELKEMKKQGILFFGIRDRRNYGMGKNLPTYSREDYFIPYTCFLYRKRNVYEWKEIYDLLQQKNASFDEIMIHFQIHFAMKDYFHRGGLLVFRLRQLYDMKKDFETALSISGFDLRMLPERVRYNPLEEDLPGY